MKTMPQKKKVFQTAIWKFYNKNKRDSLPWRKKITPYRIWVSEIMLQQTQVDRVIPFFNHWMKLFPTIQKLAGAPQAEVLRAWKGLGYNSRALRMKKTAQIICEKHHGKFPKTYDESVVMIETNIRRVYLHHFWGSDPLHGSGEGGLRSKPGEVHDREILELIKKTLPENNFREWYWALMDYGAYLGKTIPNPNKKSRHYTVQKKFQGSDREIRGKILEVLLEEKSISKRRLVKKIKSLSVDSERLNRVLDCLEQEGFLAASSSRTSVQLR